MLFFSKIPYERPDQQDFSETFRKLLKQFEEAATPELQVFALQEINQWRSHLETVFELVNIRHTIDTRDPFYLEEKEFMDKCRPLYESLVQKFYVALLQAKHKAHLESVFGHHLFALAKTAISTINDSIVPQLQKENDLITQYSRLVSSASISFEGQERNLFAMRPFEEHQDREIRKEAAAAKWSFFEKNAPELDAIYTEMVSIRSEMAKLLGYNSFIELGYDRMRRTDWNAKDASAFRKQIHTEITPLATKLAVRKKKRLGLDRLCYYDPISFLSGNPKPQGGPEEIVALAQEMYRSFSPETETFFSFMRKHGLMDLYNRTNKSPEGYCTLLADYNAPFIFANFNGTHGDIDVLTHEAGHAFQAYLSRYQPVLEYLFPTMEACEIHSMSMEYLTWPWLSLFFGKDADKQRFKHLEDAIFFLPYAACVDEFQHVVYDKPSMPPNARKALWRTLERQYQPYLDYAGNAFLEEGGAWQAKGHIYKAPFYYLDYALALTCALQFWHRSVQDHAGAVVDYLKLCQAGGSHPFKELLQVAGLHSPFESGTLSTIATTANSFLEKIESSLSP